VIVSSLDGPPHNALPRANEISFLSRMRSLWQRARAIRRISSAVGIKTCCIWVSPCCDLAIRSFINDGKLHAQENCAGCMRTVSGINRGTREDFGKDCPVLFAGKSENSHIARRSRKRSAVNRPVWLASLMLSLSLGRRCSMKSKTIRLFRLGAALLVLSGMLSLQACFFDDGGGHWHHWHHGHYEHR
jgi:hypothetical protein